MREEWRMGRVWFGDCLTTLSVVSVGVSALINCSYTEFLSLQNCIFNNATLI